MIFDGIWKFIELYDISLRNCRNYLSFVSLIVTFWNCCLALFKSSLHSPEQSRYLRACKIHSAKRGSHDRRFTDFKTAICSCRPIEVIAVHVVNSGPNNPDYSRSSSFFLSFFLSSSLLPPCSHSSSSRSDKLALLFRVREKIHSFHKYVLWRKLYEGPARRQSYIPAVHPGRIPDVNTYDRRKVQTSMPRPSIRSFCRELPC